MSFPKDPTEQDYYDLIHRYMDEPAEDHVGTSYPLDCVASLDEWKLFRAALLRWLMDQDNEHYEGFAQAKAEERPDHLRVVREDNDDRD